VPLDAWFFAIASAALFGLGLVITQFGLRDMTPAVGAMFSMPTAAAVFFAAAPFAADFAGARGDAVLLFAVVGIFFPAAITLLTFEANRIMGPYVSGAIGNLAPVFAVAVGVFVLGETLGGAGRNGWPSAPSSAGSLLCRSGDPGRTGPGGTGASPCRLVPHSAGGWVRRR